MNNYLRILAHLKQFEGDEQYHDIETILAEIAPDIQRMIFQELQNEGLIKLTGGPAPVYSFGKSSRDGYGSRDIAWTRIKAGEDSVYKGKITFKGSRYLKEELKDSTSDNYNIHIAENSIANLILKAPNASIQNDSIDSDS